MKWNVSMLCFMLLIVLASVTAHRRCLSKNTSCSNSKECCSKYCRGGQCINFGDVADDHGIAHPCSTMLCPRGQCCVLQEVICVRSPCRPIAECV